MEVKALENCYFLRDWSKKPEQLRASERLKFNKGASLYIKDYYEMGLNANPCYALVVLGDGTQWYLNNEQWELSWQSENDNNPTDELLEGKIIEFDDVDWFDWDSPISAYYRVGNVTLEQCDRIPIEKKEQENVIQFAKRLDLIREWWGSPLLINTWYRPKGLIESLCGGDNITFPSGLAVVFRLKEGHPKAFYTKFMNEIYKADNWDGCFGANLDKGYFYLDLLGTRKSWKL